MYTAIDPSVYGIKIRSTPQASISGDVSDKKPGDKDPGDSSHHSSSAQLSSASSTALHTVAKGSRNIAQVIEGTRSGEVIHMPSSALTTASPSSSTATRHPPTCEPASTDQQGKPQARQQRLAEKQKRTRRKRIAWEVGDEVDSDGEEEYWLAFDNRLEAEEARREALSPEERRQEDIELSAKAFRKHIKPQLILDYTGFARLSHFPLFLLQTAPDSRSRAKCRLPHCSDGIAPGQYRIALTPGIWNSRGQGKTSSLLDLLPFYSAAQEILCMPCLAVYAWSSSAQSWLLAK